MTTASMKPSPRNLQETASAMLRNVAPLWARARSMSFKKMIMPNAEIDRSNQQTQLIKWQQEMFHRLLNSMCLVQDGLSNSKDLDELRQYIIRTLIAVHPDGEWADFTRDKLLFLEDLFHARCISEGDYLAAKQLLFERMAEQGTTIDDSRFKSKEVQNAVDSRAAAAAAPPCPSPPQQVAHSEHPPAPPAPAVEDSTSAKKRTPINYVKDAMATLKSPAARRIFDLSTYIDDSEGKGKTSRVAQGADFRTPECPTRNPPDTPGHPKPSSEGNFESPLFKPGSAGFTRSNVPELSSDTTDLLPQLSGLSMDETESPCSVPSSPAPATQAKPTLTHSKSLTPSKLSFTPRSGLTPTKSPLGLKSEGSMTRKFSGLLRGWQKTDAENGFDQEEPPEDGERMEQRATPKKSMWQKLDLMGGGERGQDRSAKDGDDEDDFGKRTSDKDPLLSAIEDYPAEKVKSGFVNGQGPDAKKLKKQVSVRTAPTNFFIDQVLGENIKSELRRIRGDTARSNPGSQPFTNEQIDAIATRLPVDKTELMRFFPKAWCDRYGDIVLDVVHKEFNCHVSEMDGMRKAAQECRRKTGSRLATPTKSNQPHENDENRTGHSSAQRQQQQQQQQKQHGDVAAAAMQSPKKHPTGRRHARSKSQHHVQFQQSYAKVYTTEGSDFTGASVYDHVQDTSFSPVALSPSSGAARGARRGLAYEELDVKLGAEILRMPFRNFNDHSRYN